MDIFNFVLMSFNDIKNNGYLENFLNHAHYGLAIAYFITFVCFNHMKILFNGLAFIYGFVTFGLGFYMDSNALLVLFLVGGPLISLFAMQNIYFASQDR